MCSPERKIMKAASSGDQSSTLSCTVKDLHNGDFDRASPPGWETLKVRPIISYRIEPEQLCWMLLNMISKAIMRLKREREPVSTLIIEVSITSSSRPLAAALMGVLLLALLIQCQQRGREG